MSDLLTPADEAELADAVAEAAAARMPLEIRGGGTRPIGRPVQAEKTLSTAALSGITLYEPGALTLVVKAGTPMAEVEAALATEGQMLAFEPPDHRTLLGTDGTPTIGGAVAVAASGPRRIQAGACRDFMLGVRIVDGQGQVVSNGGRVMKNVTGIDLVKLMAGQYGTLGVLSEIAFKVLPAPDNTVSLISSDLYMGQAVEVFSDALGSPYEPSGLAYLPQDGVKGLTALRLEGLSGSVDYRAGELRKLLKKFGDWDLVSDADENRVLWARARDVSDFCDTNDPVWRLSVKPSDGPEIADCLDQTLPMLRYVVDWAGGLLWISAPQDALLEQASFESDPGLRSNVEVGLRGVHEVLRHLAELHGGHSTLIRASTATRAAVQVFQPEPAPIAQISAGLRARFDPNGILNPGRMG
jgi:glycolate oxidase FAD binding subunit